MTPIPADRVPADRVPADRANAYRAPVGEARAEIREKGSRFLAVAAAVPDEAAAAALLDRVRAEHPDASHHCFAWRLGAGARERSSDAGEPTGTAGVPMLQVLRGRELSDVAVVVVRWFGGTRLGKGGLARAYAAAAREAVDALPAEERFPRAEIALELPYDRLGAVLRLVHPPEVELAAERYGAGVGLTLSVRADRRPEIVAALADLGVAPRSSVRQGEPGEGVAEGGPGRDSGRERALDCGRSRN